MTPPNNPTERDREVERQRRMSLLDARKSLVTGDDGYVVFWPTSNVGAYTSYDLREIADELDGRNAAWDAFIQSDPRISDTHIIKEQSSECNHDWHYKGTDRGGSHKGEDYYKCRLCGESEYRL